MPTTSKTSPSTALLWLSDQKLDSIAANKATGWATWRGVLNVNREDDTDGDDQPVNYRLDIENQGAKDVLDNFWRIFGAIRACRQLGTAQAEAVYAAAGHRPLDWPELAWGI